MARKVVKYGILHRQANAGSDAGNTVTVPPIGLEELDEHVEDKRTSPKRLENYQCMSNNF